MIYKYAYPVDKQDKAWAAVRDAINTRGRNLKWQQRLSQMRQSIIGRAD